jgi:hypothetical protein
MEAKARRFHAGFQHFFSVIPRADRDPDHLPIGQVPGLSHGAGVDRVLAAASIEAGPSTPLTIAATRQR